MNKKRPKLKLSVQKAGGKKPPFSPLLPMFDVLYGEERAGEIARGHASIFNTPAKQKVSHPAALVGLEAYERRVSFQNWKQYKEDVKAGMGVTPRRKEFVEFIDSFKTPMHFEFWRIPRTASFLMLRGYKLSAPSIESLHEFGLRKGASDEEIQKFLKNAESTGKWAYPRPLLLLYKKPEKKKG